MTPSPADFGLTRPEAGFRRRLKPAWRIQRFLDSIDYDVKGQGCRSPRRVLRERKVQCMDGALFGRLLGAFGGLDEAHDPGGRVRLSP